VNNGMGWIAVGVGHGPRPDHRAGTTTSLDDDEVDPVDLQPHAAAAHESDRQPISPSHGKPSPRVTPRPSGASSAGPQVRRRRSEQRSGDQRPSQR